MRRVLFLDTGNKHRLHEAYAAKLTLLSGRISGTVITSGEIGIRRFSRFIVLSRRDSRYALVGYFRMFWQSLVVIRRAGLNNQRYSAVVTHDPIGTGIVGALVSAICRVPLIVELNGDVTNQANYADVGGRLRAIAKRNLYIAIARFVLARAAGIKLLYRKQLGEFAHLLSPRVHVRTFPNFLQLDEFFDRGETPTIVLVGFPFHVKGIDIAVAAFSLISAKYPLWRLVIRGWYEGVELQKLRACINHHTRVEHLPPVHRSEMPSLIGSAGIVVCPSRTEGFPRVVKEAMYSAKPCIVSDVGGLPEGVAHGRTGLIFRSEHVEELAMCLDQLISNPTLRLRLGQQAAQQARHAYSPQHFVDEFVSLVEAVAPPSVGERLLG